MYEKDQMSSGSNPVLREEKLDPWDISLESLDDYYNSFPKRKPSAFFFLKFIFDSLYCLYSVKEYDELILHEIIFESMKKHYQESFVEKFLKHFVCRYCVAFNQIFIDDIEDAKMEFFRIEKLDSKSDFMCTTLIYKQNENLNLEKVVNSFIDKSFKEYHVEISQKQCLDYINDLLKIVLKDYNYYKYSL